MIPRLHETSFDWLTYRAGWLYDLGIVYNKIHITYEREILRKYAIGYLEGEKLMCRPKENTVAVMFLKGDLQFWTHLFVDEFKIVFDNE